MTVLNSNISWCTGTLNLSVGCSRVNPEGACKNCYADVLVHRLMGGHFFDRMVLHPDRLAHLRKFEPFRDGQGRWQPKLVFVNSLSDFWHEKIPDPFVHSALDAFEKHPNIIIQILTKRPGRMRRFLTERYRNSKVPAHFWIGVTCEDNRVTRMLDILRATKDALGEFTAFTSVEPITAPTDQIDLTGINWTLTGGESGGDARPMEFSWLETINDRALNAGIPLHFKQWGTVRNNPIVQRIMRDTGLGITKAWEHAIEHRLELASEEKGGATYKGAVYHQKPKHFYELTASLNK